MKAEELRIGNYISYRDEWDCEVGSLGYTFATHNKDLNDFLHGIRCGSDDINEYNPIVLTEEWLLKMGFVWSDTFGSFVKKGYMIEKIGDLLCDRRYGVVIKYVHQLQNFYFMVKGNELSL